MKDLTCFLLGFAIVCALSVGVCFAIVVAAVHQRDAARTSERLAWEQVHQLRSTLASQGLGELF